MLKIGTGNTVLRSLRNKTTDILDYIIDDAEDNGTWIATKERVQLLMAKFAVSRPTFYRILGVLVESGVLLKGESRSIYGVNSEMIKYIDNESVR